MRDNPGITTNPPHATVPPRSEARPRALPHLITKYILVGPHQEKVLSRQCPKRWTVAAVRSEKGYGPHYYSYDREIRPSCSWNAPAGFSGSRGFQERWVRGHFEGCGSVGMRWVISTPSFWHLSAVQS